MLLIRDTKMLLNFWDKFYRPVKSYFTKVFEDHTHADTKTKAQNESSFFLLFSDWLVNNSLTPTSRSLEGPDWTKNKEPKQVNWLIPYYLYLELPLHLHTLYNKEHIHFNFTYICFDMIYIENDTSMHYISIIDKSLWNEFLLLCLALGGSGSTAITAWEQSYSKSSGV